MPTFVPRTPRAVLSSALVAFAGLFMIGDAIAASTYYVRTDGGDASQCDGRSDAPYPGSGSAQACAWKHPFVALPPGKTARIAGGDTLIIGGGSYMMGIGAPDSDRCASAWSYDCHLPPLPSGPSASQPTRILGKGFDAGCSAAPQLWGTERAYTVLNLRGSNNIELACLEITDRHACIRGHGAGNACPSTGTWARAGIIAQDAASVQLTDITIHGMADKGIHAGRLRDWTMTRLTLRANGWIGWDGDIGSGVSSNSGNMIFRQSEIAWNGCAENYPDTDIHACWGQQTGGYGDGLGTHQTGGHWLFEDVLVHHNTSDGIDLLYMADGGSVTMRRVWAEGNAGNQLKTKGNSRIENSVVVGNCAYFDGKFNMLAGDNCRALGNALSVSLFENSTIDLVNNTISSQGDCLVLSGGGGTAAKLTFTNNVLIGEVDWRQPSERSCAHYSDRGSEVVSWDRNHVSGVKNNTCPTGSLCNAPLLASTAYSAFDPTPLDGSPVIDVANSSRAPATDYHNRSRVGAGADIGAVEKGGSGGSEPPSEPVPPPTEPVPPPTEPTPTIARVADVRLVHGQQGRWTTYEALVTVVDAGGRRLPAAVVRGRWNGASASDASATTGSDGVAVVSGGRTKKPGLAVFCVQDISGSGIVFDGVQACAGAEAMAKPALMSGVGGAGLPD